MWWPESDPAPSKDDLMMDNSRKKMHLAVLGAGSRGRAYSEYAEKHPDRLVIEAVAEPDDFRREVFSRRFGIPKDRSYASWQDLLRGHPVVDAVLITTPDNDHVNPAVAFAEAGYNLLLEKPMAPHPEGCFKIVRAVEESQVLFGLCHVLLYTPHTKLIRQIIDTGALGEIISLQRLEPVGFWHFAHSYVRGNWRREDTSSSSLLAKSCHDIDWILHVMGKEVASVSSFGSLNHFRREKMPRGAGERCTECSVEPECPYSAPRFYGRCFEKGELVWPLDTVIPELRKELLDEALRSGPYGRCVYRCDNDVMDNQVVNLEFSDNRTADFSMMAFTETSHRKTRLFGSRGMLETDGESVRIFDFVTEKWRQETIRSGAATADSGHGGGDFGLMDAFISAWESGDQSLIKSSVQESLLSHRVVFAAEQSRREKRVVPFV